VNAPIFNGSTLSFKIAGSTIWQIDASGNLLAAIDATYKIGTTGANRPLSIDVAGSINTFNLGVSSQQASGIQLGSRVFFGASVGDGILALYDSALTAFNRLQFGGTTASFPSIKRSTTGLQIRLADDSAFAPLSCSTLTHSGPEIATTTSNGAVTTGSTINTAGFCTVRVTAAGAVTGVILQSGTVDGQKVSIVHESVAANTITMAAAGTSHVADGVGTVIAGLTAQSFIWNANTSLWYHEK
jgi:hypothetical protein